MWESLSLGEPCRKLLLTDDVDCSVFGIQTRRQRPSDLDIPNKPWVNSFNIRNSLTSDYETQLGRALHVCEFGTNLSNCSRRQKKTKTARMATLSGSIENAFIFWNGRQAQFIWNINEWHAKSILRDLTMFITELRLKFQAWEQCHLDTLCKDYVCLLKWQPFDKMLDFQFVAWFVSD